MPFSHTVAIVLEGLESIARIGRADSILLDSTLWNLEWKPPQPRVEEAMSRQSEIQSSLPETTRRPRKPRLRGPSFSGAKFSILVHSADNWYGKHFEADIESGQQVLSPTLPSWALLLVNIA